MKVKVKLILTGGLISAALIGAAVHFKLQDTATGTLKVSEPKHADSPAKKLEPKDITANDKSEETKIDAVNKVEPTLSAQQLLEVDMSKEEEYYSFLLENFPELKQEISEYRQSVGEQREKVLGYKEKIANRNQQISQYGSTSASLDSMLKAERDELLLSANVLGKKAQELNESIRLAAAKYN
ncbi:hypothetical protein [Pseudoalteromonas sp. S2755]|uniref:hypothetical protein n=1 Tax=Pseudoalteromonas sp. S2755 TaxID=2066523 RepID=UPI00110A2CA4|nr:hypothetical protein [Pseudoalteromonas sp. S2755]TMN35353.1 hypothetical protein CWC03_15535 [Pseudoalteromonas sp. S2755]